MGQGYLVKCNRCRYSVSYYEGIGFKDSLPLLFEPQDNFRYLLERMGSKTVFKKITNWMKDKDYRVESYGYRIDYCERCQHFKSHLHFHLIFEHDAFQTEYPCFRCKQPMIDCEKTPYSPFDYHGEPCPKCVQGTLSVPIMMWD